jgi:hypothetical protein
LLEGLLRARETREKMVGFVERRKRKRRGKSLTFLFEPSRGVSAMTPKPAALTPGETEVVSVVYERGG